MKLDVFKRRMYRGWSISTKCHAKDAKNHDYEKDGQHNYLHIQLGKHTSSGAAENK